ncbi:hypothetical protein DPMN_139530 [Dreissena polymorpha]|uniref:Uncharacterized protein n=1 Tax=Dreissena polymorpha TaxID=45954 RepID=A0A9D4G9Q0_DREPO|nr:hypothetical protein DPMN_139530 [Dreissena polymorpha]
MLLINSLIRCGHVFLQTGTILKLIQDIIKPELFSNSSKILLSGNKYTSRVLTIPPHLGHVFQETRTIFELVQDIIRTNVLTMLHENWIIIMTLSVKQGTKLCEINVASRVLTRFNHIRQNALPSGGHVFQQTRIISELNQDVIGTYVVTMFHTNQTINLASRVKNAPLNGGHFPEDRTINVASRALTRKNARTPGGHVF